MCLSAATYGEAPNSTEFHGRITTSRKTEPTKKIPMRATTDRVAFWTASSGSRLSAAATVTISAPTIEKITTTMAAKTAPTPFGKNPPCDVRLEKSPWWPGRNPRTKTAPTARKIAMVATLIPANQNSNSPKDDTENRFVAVISINRHSESSHSGAWNQ